MYKLFALTMLTVGALASASTADAQGTVKIGVAVSQTGNLADSATPYFKGLELWREQANARGGLNPTPASARNQDQGDQRCRSHEAATEQRASTRLERSGLR